MKVNISGKGLIPVLKRLAPVRNVELSQKDIIRILGYRYFKVFNAETGLLITKENVDNLFKPIIKPNTSTPAPMNDKPIPVEPIEEIKIKEETPKPQFLKVTEIPATNTTIEAVIEPIIDEKTIIEEEIVEEVENKINEEITETKVSETTEEVVEDKPEEPVRPYYNRKKNRKR